MVQPAVETFEVWRWSLLAVVVAVAVVLLPAVIPASSATILLIGVLSCVLRLPLVIVGILAAAITISTVPSL